MAKILVCAAHPDDETVGAGGTIALHAARGDQLALVIFTKAYPPDWDEAVLPEKRREAEAAAKILGIRDVHFLDFPTVKLDTIPHKELNDRLRGIVDEFRPETVYTTFSGDINKDHRIVADVASVASRPVPGGPVKRLLAYEALSSTEWGAAHGRGHFAPNVFVDISSTLEVKLAAMAEYRTEIRPYPHPRSLEGVRILAQRRGLEVGLHAAEGFVLLREIR